MALRPATTLALPLLLAAPALAQQEETADPVFNLPRTTQPQADPNRQGPELDVYRGAPVQLPPPVTVPTITPPPPVVAAPPPAGEAPIAQQSQRPAVRPAPTPAPAPTQAPPAPLQDAASEPPAPAPQPSQPEAAAPAPSIEPAPVQQGQAFPWPWVAAALALLAGLIAAFKLMRRKGPAEDTAETGVVEEEQATPVPALQPAPSARPPARPALAPQRGPRPWIDMSLDVRSARLSLMGVTIDYVLTLHNRGDQIAEDMLIRTIMANADSEQQKSLHHFFAGDTGLPTHSVVSIEPGSSHSVKGELRLLPDQIAPVQMDGRALLIPLAAFDVQYRWTVQDGGMGAGRTGRAFIIGQEKAPPSERLAPFRADLGPRQYRAPGSRATALSLTS